MDLEKYRRDFDRSSKKSVSMPIAGAIVWFIVTLLSTQVSERNGIIILLIGSGAILPLALFIARLRNEILLSSQNPLAKLMGSCVLMVNLLWAVHVPLFIYAPTFVPLSIGVALGLHWVVYSWVIQHPLGIIHAVTRTVLVLIAWIVFTDQRLLAIGVVVVIVYCVSIWQMLSRATSHT